MWRRLSRKPLVRHHPRSNLSALGGLRATSVPQAWLEHETADHSDFRLDVSSPT